MNEIATWKDDASKSYYFLKGYAYAHKFPNMQRALILAKKLHEGQYRKGGAEYLVHPLRVCTHLICFGFEDDVLLSAALLHDVVEDVESIRNCPIKIVQEYGISEEVLNTVILLTKNKEHTTETYYHIVKTCWRSLLIKLSDRCNNVSTMQYFTLEKMKKYIDETKEFVLPLCAYGKLHYSEYSDVITAMKYHITALCTTLESLIPLIEKDETKSN